MILKNLCKLWRSFSSQVRQDMKWKTNANGVEIYYNKPNFLSTLVFYATINQREVTYPVGVNSQTELITFLFDRQNPKVLQIKQQGKPLLLRNQACNQSTKQIIQTIRDPQSVYHYLAQFTSVNKPQYFVQRRDYMTRFYLKLQAESYCRVKKINKNDLLNQKLKNQLLNYLNLKNSINSEQFMENSIREEAQIKEEMKETKNKIDQLNQYYLNIQSWYKKLAILITFTHLITFGYAIFGVEWLGWDIIEPLTYTVGVIYTLIGIRFYRKYTLDRSSKTIKDILFKLVMPPKMKLAFIQATERLQTQQKELKLKFQQRMIIKNRLAFRTSLIQNLKNTLV